MVDATANAEQKLLRRLFRADDGFLRAENTDRRQVADAHRRALLADWMGTASAEEISAVVGLLRVWPSPDEREPTTFERAGEAVAELDRAVQHLREAGGLDGLLVEIRSQLEDLIADLPQDEDAERRAAKGLPS